ncbi:MAG: bifunctional serine/threonine-protein kinase/formylglycine-generating enzyme family protein [Phycisphaerales bacterium]|nr:bifunctional serine/threonine-protein kinase/formylglycine-generating enzyme family protein [Phycisphaerales bacterium]
MENSWNEKNVFLKALDLNPEQREDYLLSSCPDEESADRIRRLIQRAQESHANSESGDGGTRFERVDEFEIIRTLGSGGSGVVYLANDLILNRHVALKVLIPGGFHSTEMRDRFRREARAAANLKHPSIVAVHRFFESDHDAYLVSEFVDGPTLAEFIRDHIEAKSDSRNLISDQSWFRSVGKIAVQISDALESAHRAGIVHRDVKPSNIMIAAGQTARLTDFGIASMAIEATLGQTQGILGSCHYMSPEQAAIAGSKPDQRSDVYSLGVVLYEMLTLRRPFEGEDIPSIIRALTEQDPVEPIDVNSEIPRDLNTICLKAMAKKPSDRYQSAESFGNDLRYFLQGQSILAIPTGRVRKLKNTLVSRRSAIAMGGVAAMSIGTSAYLGRRYIKEYLKRNSPKLGADLLNPVAIVAHAQIDIETGTVGEVKILGPASKGPYYLDAGYYRVIVYASSTEYAEYTRLFRGTDTVTLPNTRLVTNPENRMVFVPAGEDSLFDRNESNQSYIDSVVDLDAFWIDNREVSNADYTKFLNEAASPPPIPPLWMEDEVINWRKEHGDELWGLMPVVTVGFLEAQMYAEWAGKRLPTMLEWLRVARGERGYEYPWGNGPYDSSIHSVLWGNYDVSKFPAGGQVSSNILGIAKEYLESFGENFRPRSKDDVVFAINTISGSLGKVHGLAGNVMEWTETIPSVGLEAERRIMGIESLMIAQPFSKHGIRHVTSSQLMGIGFRCAKSFIGEIK